MALFSTKRLRVGEYNTLILQSLGYIVNFAKQDLRNCYFLKTGGQRPNSLLAWKIMIMAP